MVVLLIISGTCGDVSVVYKATALNPCTVPTRLRRCQEGSEEKRRSEEWKDCLTVGRECIDQTEYSNIFSMVLFSISLDNSCFGVSGQVGQCGRPCRTMVVPSMEKKQGEDNKS